MRKILIIKCSPHAGGATDRLADFFAQGVMEEGRPASALALRDYQIYPCVGCGFCAAPPHECRVHDDCGRLMAEMAGSALSVMAAPIYFYALPAICAAFINRAQAFWAGRPLKAFPPAVLILASGRKAGARLFSGALLSFHYFFKALGGNVLAAYAARGVEGADSASALRDFMLEKGRAWARFAALNCL